MSNPDIAAQEKIEREGNQAMVDMLLDSMTERTERAAHCLQALIAASVSMDLLTASVLIEIGNRMQHAIHDCCEECSGVDPS